MSHAPVSAVITTFNEEAHISKCLESVFNQTVKLDETILIDAESTDNTLQKAQQYPLTKFYSVKFRNIYRSKRAGILLAKNDVVLCVDGDTWIDPRFVEYSLVLLNKGYDVATGHIYPYKPNVLTNFLAWTMNTRATYLSGPAYVLNRQKYVQVCNLKNGDVCERSKEIPLQKLYAAKCPRLIIFTDLPSTTQKKVGVLLALSAVTVPATLFLFTRKK